MSENEGSAKNTWTLARVLAVVDKEAKTGILEAQCESVGIRIHLRKGYIVGVDESDGGDSWVLGDYLVDSGVVRVEALLEAKKAAQKSHEDIESVLVRENVLSEDVLRRFIEIQCSERIFPLFRDKTVALRFNDDRPIQAPFMRPWPVNYVLKEAERRHRLWPTLIEHIGPKQAVYNKDAALLGEVLGYLDFEPDADGTIPEISANARIVYFFANGRRTLQELARASGLTLFDAYRSIAELSKHYLVERGQKDRPIESTDSKASLIPRVVTVLTYVIIATLLAVGGQWLSVRIDSFATSATASTPRIDRSIRRTYRQQVEEALHLYELRHNEFPRRLGGLISGGLLDPGAIVIFDTLQYTPQSNSYILEKTKK